MVGFYGISTIVGYLIQNHVYTYNIYENDTDSFLIQLNSMHPSLKLPFTVEKESYHQLAFLDEFVHKTSTAFLTSVYRKPTFSGLYTRWDSFCPQQRKINLIKTLVHRALMISTKCFLDDEIEFIRSTLSRNGYPLSVLDGVVHDVINKFDRAKRCTVNKCPVYLRLPYIRGQLVNTPGSSIADHMINNRECMADFNVDRFSILSWSHSLYHLKVLETLYVRSLQPSLC